MGFIDKGYSIKMNDDEIVLTFLKAWYIPCHPVFNPMKPNKLRLVSDAATTCEQRTINATLQTGSDLLNSLIGILLHFATKKQCS